MGEDVVVYFWVECFYVFIEYFWEVCVIGYFGYG